MIHESCKNKGWAKARWISVVITKCLPNIGVELVEYLKVLIVRTNLSICRKYKVLGLS